MKKLILLLSILFIFSCSSDEIIEESPKDCLCYIDYYKRKLTAWGKNGPIFTYYYWKTEIAAGYNCWDATEEGEYLGNVNPYYFQVRCEPRLEL